MCSFDVVFGIVCSAREWNRGGVRTLALGPLLLLLLGSGCCGCLKRCCQCLSSSNMSSTGAVPFCRMWVVRGLEGWKSLLNINPCARSFSNVGRHVCADGPCFPSNSRLALDSNSSPPEAGATHFRFW